MNPQSATSVRQTVRRPIAVKAYAITVAVGVNFLFVLALSIHPSVRNVDKETKELEVHAITASIWVPIKAAQPEARAERFSINSWEGAIQLPEIALSLDLAGTDTSIHVGPESSIDWHNEAGKLVTKWGKIDGEPAINSKPKILQLPESTNDPKPGDSLRLEGGVQLTWISKDCYILSDPLRTYAGSGRHCKPNERDRRSAEFAARLEEAAKPSYLRKPVLPPDGDAEHN